VRSQILGYVQGTLYIARSQILDNPISRENSRVWWGCPGVSCGVVALLERPGGGGLEI
jgi:hypothetical protein